VYRTSWKEHARQVRSLLAEHLARSDALDAAAGDEGAVLAAPALQRWGV
jgi:hypothetical protein